MPNLGPFIVSGLSTGALYALCSVGLVVLYRASGTINLAQGAIGAVSAILAWQFVDWDLPAWVGWVVGVAAATAVSFAYGRFIAPRLAHSDAIVRAVATLGLALVVLGVVDLIWGEYTRSLRLPTDAYGVRVLGVRITYTRAIAMGLAIAVTLGMLLFLNKTRIGLAMRAMANQREISALLGVPILKVDAWAWVISGLIAGVSGILLANLTRMAPLFLTFVVIPAVAAAIAGRMRSLTAAVIGGLAIGVIEALGTPFAAVAPYRTVVPFLFAILALVWLQRGGAALIGSAAAPGDSEQRRIAPPSAATNRKTLVQIGLVAIGVLGVALVLPEIANSYWLRILTSVVIFSLATLAVGVIYAQLGMVSLCQFALVGVGGWFSLRLYHATHLPFEASLLCAGVAAAAFGLIFGLPALRMRGLYLALTTLMIAGGFQVMITATDFPDGGTGILGKVIDAPRQYMGRPWLGFSDAAYFRYCLVVLIIGYLIVFWHQRSKAGRAWAMIRRSEACALSAGVNIVAYKVWAFTLAGFLAGICGGLLAGLIGQLDLRTFPASDSVILFALTVIGGAYNWLGPIIAALLLRAVPGILNDFYIDGNIATIVFGAGLLHALITAPQGISGQILGLVNRLWARTAGVQHEKTA
jgi:branched-subunit amino acid ABC-type transport system permease component